MSNNEQLITVTKIQNKLQYNVNSTNPIFSNEYLKVDVHHDCMIISVPTIDYRGRMYKTNKNKVNPNRHHTRITLLDEMPTGRFEIDQEDSTEDELVVYF